MSGKYRRKSRNKTIINVLMIPLFIVFSYVAVRVGIMAGNYASGMETNIVEDVDTSHFKTTLNYSIPLIDTVYNSGNINISFMSEIGNLIKSIFEFDLNSPYTILNAQSSYFYSYYNKDYLPGLEKRIAENEKKAEPGTGNKPEEGGDPQTTDKEPLIETDPEPGIEEDETKQLKEDASSISWPPEEEGKGQGPVSSGKIVIQNETKLKVDRADIDKMLKEPLKLKFDRKGPWILIYHTHTTESYLSKPEDINKKNIPNRVTDIKKNIVRVGDELTKNLENKYGIDVLHNGTFHDIPNYNLSYVNSMNTLSKILKSYPSLKLSLDLHRDGIGGNKKLRSVAKINGKNAAQVMFVVGSNERLIHPEWRENLKLAVKLQAKLNEIAPGLAKPIYISRNRYNQHMAQRGITIEIGGDGNTLTEALESTKYLAKAISDVIK